MRVTGLRMGLVGIGLWAAAMVAGCAGLPGLPGLPGLSGSGHAGAGDSVRPPQGLTLPLKCNLAENCWVTGYVDLDPAKGSVQDAGCGHRSKDGQQDTHFGLPDESYLSEGDWGVKVLAVADGTVTALRDGVRDRLVDGPRDEYWIKDKPCGNGLVIDHGQGFKSYYCHLRKASFKVQQGDVVQQGQHLGFVGESGQTSAIHLAYKLTYNGEVVDPFTGVEARRAQVDVTCKTPLAQSLWQPAWHQALAYQPAYITAVGLAHTPPKAKDIRHGYFDQMHSAPNDMPRLIVWAYLHGLRDGDEVQFLITDQANRPWLSSTHAIESDRDELLQYVGKTLMPDSRWLTGTYFVKVTVDRSDQQKRRTIATKTWAFDIN